MTHTTYETYEAWFAAANEACIAICGLGIEDLPDGASYYAYTDEMPPREYAEELLANEGFPF